MQGPHPARDHGGFQDDRLDDRLTEAGRAPAREAPHRGHHLPRALEQRARAGLLDGRRATTNKAFFQWVADQGPRVTWVKVARWVDDGKFVTSSGVSAGIDMALHVISRTHGREVSENVARAMEYDWHTEADWDPFAKVWGLV